jgi:murein DD-endopeptidase MepM/ murein hydrolase activator NlpD
MLFSKRFPRACLACSLPGFLLGLCILASVVGCGKQDAESKSRAEAEALAAKTPAIKVDTVIAKVRPGDTYAGLMRNLDLAPEVVHGLMERINDHFPVKLYAGQIYRVVCQRPFEGGEPALMAFTLEERGGLFRHMLHRIESALSDSAHSIPAAGELSYRGDSVVVRRDTVALHGVLATSLYEAVIAQGETPALLDQITQVFAWDIDFFRDPRVGDSFSVLVEKNYRDDGRFLGYGQLLCARYVNQGHAFQGFRYKDGYYDAEGKSLEKLLMKAPLKFSRITSGFTHSRLHPVLGIRRPHFGVDYAGPVGTPIFAAGDGVIELAGWSGGFGNCVKIRHNSVYTTYYGHLNGFAKSAKRGARVKQGETIGYLGSTGLSTGPHLDYRVQKNGAFINPASLKTDAKEGVSEAEMTAFLAQRGGLLARLDGKPDPVGPSLALHSEPAVSTEVGGGLQQATP